MNYKNLYIKTVMDYNGKVKEIGGGSLMSENKPEKDQPDHPVHPEHPDKPNPDKPPKIDPGKRYGNK